MPNLSWNEVKARAIRFAREWQDAASERADKQTFYNEFFEVFGIRRRLVALFEANVRNLQGKALEYGKDIWMKYVLPTQHVLYFGVQVKKGKLDASGDTKAKNANVAEIHNQVTMMLGHEIFDPEIGKKVLVDHAFIVAGGEITKAAKNWLGNRLDATKRSQVMFMDREDLLNLFVVTNLPLPKNASSTKVELIDDDPPF